MRKPPSWMTQTDERILEALRDHPGSTCFNISKESQRCLVDAYAHYIRRRCRVLEHHGLLNRIDVDEYEVTSVGIEFLAEKVDLRESSG